MQPLIQETQHWCDIWGIRSHLRGIKNFSFLPMTTGNGKVDDLAGYVVLERMADWLCYTRLWFETGFLGAE
jgi:hypothetical protein